MRILTRYVFVEFLVPLVYCLVGFFAIYVLFELSGSFSRLMEARPPFGDAVSYFCGYLAPYVKYLMPAALLLATIYTMWSFCRHSELIAMRAGGVGFLTIVRPLLAVALVAAGGVVWLDECYVPARAQWAKRFKSARFRYDEMEFGKDLVYCNVVGRRTWSVGAIEDVRGERLRGVRVTQDRGDGRRERTIFAERADFMDGEWWLTNPVVQHFDVSGREVPSPTPGLDGLKLRCFPELDERPADLVIQNRDWSFTSVAEKFRFIRMHPDMSAHDRADHLYDAWAQLFAPLACLIVTLFAIPAGIASGRQSVFRGILGALALFFAFYAFTLLAMACEKKGWLPPLAAVLLPDVVFLAVGLRGLWRQR